MSNKDFTVTISVDATPQQVFESIQDVRGWWSENIGGDTATLNSVFDYHYQDVHRARFKVTESVPGKRIAWYVLSNYFKFTKDEREWQDTSVIFDISEKGGHTEMKFTHKGLVPDYECYSVCHDAWTHYITQSLKDLILTGKGMPTPKETGPAQPAPAGADSSKPDVAGSIRHRFVIHAVVENVYAALTTQEGLAGWWTPETVAKPETGSVSVFRFGPDYYKEMKIEKLQPYSEVKWRCIHGDKEWIDTTITFELEPHTKGAVLNFHHDGWRAYTDMYSSCSFDWALFLRSLKFLCETGKGYPYPEFNKP